MRLEIDYPQHMIPANVQVLIDRLDDTDNAKVGRLARKEEDRGEFAYGLIGAVKQAIQDRNRSNYQTMSNKDAAIDRMLYITDSSGKRRPRRWGKL